MSEKTETRIWQAISMSMAAEEIKLESLVPHRHSLGIGRESILRSILIGVTPEPYRVKTGFMINVADETTVSDQCDILVYDPTVSQPYYRIDEFVVVPCHTARLAIEVRSNLTVWERKDKKKISGLDQMFKVGRSVRQLPFQRKVLGFAYRGVKFDSFVSAVAKRVKKKGDILNVPECMAVHEENYFCVRVTKRTVKLPQKTDPNVCIAFDCSKSGHEAKGLATAFFLGIYNACVRKELSDLDRNTIEIVSRWAHETKIPPTGIRIINEKGRVSCGPIPE